MLKSALLLLTLTITTSLFSQIIFREKQFDNGLTYPVLEHPHDSSAYININNQIFLGLSDLETSDFCASAYGYVQKGSHMQLEIMCNCIEMDEGEFRYFLISTDADAIVPYSDLFEEKSRLTAIELIYDKIDAYQANNSNPCGAEFGIRADREFDALDIKMKKIGLEINPEKSRNCHQATILIPWEELKEYLKFNYI